MSYACTNKAFAQLLLKTLLLLLMLQPAAACIHASNNVIESFINNVLEVAAELLLCLQYTLHLQCHVPAC
jgi:hypothetical protein